MQTVYLPRLTQSLFTTKSSDKQLIGSIDMLPYTPDSSFASWLTRRLLWLRGRDMPVLGIFGHDVNIGPSAARENNLGSDGLMLLPVERLSATHRTVQAAWNLTL
jgi:hypothetical protein